MPYTRRLDPVELRVCGALMEKQQATPDSYPLTVNALLSACNQKSNREPVMSLGEEAVRDALERLRKDVLVWRSSGARAEKWDHRLGSRWHLDRRGLALMTLLMLRGAQTPGELRSRSGRLHSFDDVDQVEATLRSLAEGDNPLVRELPRQPGQRESRWRHLMGRETPESGGAGHEEAADGAVASATAAAESAVSTRVPELQQERSELEVILGRVESLEATVVRLGSRLSELERELGVDSDDSRASQVSPSAGEGTD